MPSSRFVVHPGQFKQTIRGIGFEIMADSIGSGNAGLPEEPTGVPHDLAAEERTRFYQEMLKGFRYCRLAGGLLWRGLDTEQKHLRPRWPEQLDELREMIRAAGIEGISYKDRERFARVSGNLHLPAWKRFYKYARHY